MRSNIKTFGLFLVFLIFMILPGAALSAETDGLNAVLDKIDGYICTTPKKMADHFAKGHVLISDDKRQMLASRIESYQHMIGELEEMNCKVDRKVLNSAVNGNIGYMLVDEMISVTSRLSTDDRQHSVCTYVFVKDGGSWKVLQEHCSSLPDYSIVPGDDALYYYHNPVY